MTDQDKLNFLLKRWQEEGINKTFSDDELTLLFDMGFEFVLSKCTDGFFQRLIYAIADFIGLDVKFIDLMTYPHAWNSTEVHVRLKLTKEECQKESKEIFYLLDELKVKFIQYLGRKNKGPIN